jgi:hypothetical protein
MLRTRARFTLLLIFLLAVGVTRCLADCTVAGFNPAGSGQVPPCHHHRQAPGHETSMPSCAPDVLLPGSAQLNVPQVSVIGASMPAPAAPVIAEVQFSASGRLSILLASSRPKAGPLSSVVLRI